MQNVDILAKEMVQELIQDGSGTDDPFQIISSDGSLISKNEAVQLIMNELGQSNIESEHPGILVAIEKELRIQL